MANSLTCAERKMYQKITELTLEFNAAPTVEMKLTTGTELLTYLGENEVRADLCKYDNMRQSVHRFVQRAYIVSTTLVWEKDVKVGLMNTPLWICFKYYVNQ